jgi:integrase
MPLRSLADEARLRSTLDALKEKDRPWTDQEMATHLLTWQRMNPRYIAQLQRDLRRMAMHPIAPVRLHGTRYELVDSFLRFAHHREYAEGKGYGALKNDYKAIKALGKFRGVPPELWPKPPVHIKKAKELLPSPEQIRELIFSDHGIPNAKNSYEAHLLQYLLLFNFGFGVRFPSEVFALRVQDFDPKTHTIIITEPKKSGRTRRLFIEPTYLCCGTNTPSLAQFLRWRKRLDANVGGSDKFFLKPDGSEFPSKEALTQWVNGRINPDPANPRFPWYYGYLGRTWNANARLIECGFEYGTVADWLGHESVDMTRENYEKDARIQAKIYGDAWLRRALFGRRGQQKGAP